MSDLVDKETNPEHTSADNTQTGLFKRYLEQTEIKELDITAEELDLSFSRIDEIPTLKDFQNLRRLCLRQNLIKTIEDPNRLPDHLESLSLYGNLLTAVKNIDHLHDLTYLDLSFNRIKQIENIETLVKLEELYFANNRIREIKNLEPFVNLRLLELGSNKIKMIDGLETLVNLEELHLGRNHIKQIENLGCLKKLRILVLSSNYIEKICGLENLENLKQFFIAHNRITEIEGFEKNVTHFLIDSTGDS
ncbi:Protein phosphatase 1 regulatory subunit 7 [Thelohanellus kitauei]|uniref:Protein phosphatase 1 regulatory subunit 7 n=1 Tax=Thelohanellus kitauei TaxID=669202 RepID=A0A0C2MQX0_THEKT|nr:Protein phosphatase 1 regulatory subunit 7 [Thelohanellus kitauei]